ncbi:MAG: hypothetical protein IPN27_11590 [Cellvibrionales bacterium]|nr:hypothetical protein [Cellvibrionales bacterium]
MAKLTMDDDFKYESTPVQQELDAAWDAWRKRTAEEAIIEAANAAPEDKARAEAWAAWTKRHLTRRADTRAE